MVTKIFGYKGGTFSKEELNEAEQNGNPLTLDMAIPGDCLNDCIFCGYSSNIRLKSSIQTVLLKRSISAFKITVFN